MEIAEFGFLFEVEKTRCILKKVLQPDFVLEIPSYVKGRPVTDIGECAFAGCRDVATLMLPPTLSNIRAFAFAESEFKDIKREINQKSPILYVDRFAFADCTQLGSIIFGGATFLEASGYQFKGCTNLNHVDSLNIRGLIPIGAFECCGLYMFVFSAGSKIAFNAFKDTNLGMAFFAGNIGNTSNFFHTHKNVKIICEENNPLTDMVYEGYEVAIKERKQVV